MTQPTDSESYAHQLALHQAAIRRAEQAERELRDIQNIFARILGKETFSDSPRENVLQVERKLKVAIESLTEQLTKAENERVDARAIAIAVKHPDDCACEKCLDGVIIARKYFEDK